MHAFTIAYDEEVFDEPERSLLRVMIDAFELTWVSLEVLEVNVGRTDPLASFAKILSARWPEANFRVEPRITTRS